ncbi:MAG TPA: glycosyltransferase [Polyangia bacterium]|jgi:trehalose synthase
MTTIPGKAADGLREVEVSAQPLERFIPVLGEARVEEAGAAGARLRATMGRRSFWSVNSTAVGGGVAEMLRPLLAYARGAGIDAHWLVIHGDHEFFRITKRVHNTIHGERGDGSSLGKPEREHYERVLRHNADALLARVKPGDVALLHDPQTAGLCPALSEAGVHVVWRSHIGTEATNRETERGWQLLVPYLRHASALVFSRAAYVPPALSAFPTMVIQPSIDPFSVKNQELPAAVVRDILATTGLAGAPTGRTTATYQKTDGTMGEVRHAADVMSLGGPPAFETPLVIQLSRWDTLKDPRGVMQGFADLVAEGGAVNAELLLVGPNVRAVADDPDGARVFHEVVVAWRRLPHDVRRRIHLASIPVHDIDENAAIVNALQRHATVVVQKSLQEGFGLTVTEPMWKARPVVATRVGGIPDQIIDGESGLLLDDPADLVGFGRLLGRVLDDRALAARLGTQARERVREHFLGLRHLVQYANLFERLLR